MANALYEIPLRTLDGQETTLGAYSGKVLLIVNVASKCGFTPQYTGLEALYQKYRDAGLVVLGFPCDQFGHQEPGDASEIQNFCSLTYGVSFPMFAKIEVNGANAHPLYKALEDVARGILWTKSIKWNFTKFLIDRKGHIVKRFDSQVTPEEIDGDIKKLL